jgi:hypothetical protein
MPCELKASGHLLFPFLDRITARARVASNLAKGAIPQNLATPWQRVREVIKIACQHWVPMQEPPTPHPAPSPGWEQSSEDLRASPASPTLCIHPRNYAFFDLGSKLFNCACSKKARAAGVVRKAFEDLPHPGKMPGDPCLRQDRRVCPAGTKRPGSDYCRLRVFVSPPIGTLTKTQ